MSDPDNINPQDYLQHAEKPLRCPECGSFDLLPPDEEGLVDCDNCGIWFKPGHPENEPGGECKKCGSPLQNDYCIDRACPFSSRWQSEIFNVDGVPSNRVWPELYEEADDLNLTLYLAQFYPRAGDQLEVRGFKEWIVNIWRRTVEPAWQFEVVFSRGENQRPDEWTFRITWLPKMALVHYAVHDKLPSLLFDIDRYAAAWEGKRYVATSGDDIVVENDASLPLALSLMEIDSDYFQPALPFQPPITLGTATQRKLPFEPPLQPTYSPPPSKWTPPPRVYKQDPDDIDPMDYINAAPNYGERRIRISYSKITWHDPPDEDYDEEHGWEDEEGVDLSVDEFDDEGTTPVDKAVKFLEDKGAQDTGNDDWYDSEPEQDYHDGSDTTYSYHLVGYTDEELSEIYDRVVGARRRRWRGESADPDDIDFTAYALQDKPNLYTPPKWFKAKSKIQGLAKRTVSASPVAAVIIIPGNSPPVLTGSKGGFFTKGGRRIYYPGAYAKTGWSNMEYITNTELVHVGLDWLHSRLPTETAFYVRWKGTKDPKNVVE